MEKFEIIKDYDDYEGETREYAVFEDGYKAEIYSGRFPFGRFFFVPNRLSSQFDFSDRIKDVYETIKSGNGDYSSANLDLCNDCGIFKYRNVAYFLNREVGESLRASFLKRWENVEFGYAIKHKPNEDRVIGYICQNPYCGFRLNDAFLNNNGDIIYDKDPNYNNPICFHTKEDANTYIDTFVEKATELANLLIAEIQKNTEYVRSVIDSKRNDTLYLLHGICNPDIFDIFTNSKKRDNNVIDDMCYDMLTDDLTSFKQDFKIDKQDYATVVQYAKNMPKDE